MTKTPEEMAEEYRENHDECEFARDAFLAGYNAGYTAGFDGCLKIQEAVTEHLEKQMVEEMYVRMEPLLKEDK